jgi:glycosyltransferase involved in cell wall biosynthesis
LVLVGDGPKRQILQEFAKENKLNTVHFLPFLSQARLKTIYRNATFFILPSKYGETWGLVVNEAMASGLPVLVSNQAGCASTLVKKGVNGFTFSPNNINELSELLYRMDKLIDQTRNEMGQISREIISEWGLERFCQGAYEAIQYVSGKKPKRIGLLTRVILKLWKGRYRPV